MRTKNTIIVLFVAIACIGQLYAQRSTYVIVHGAWGGAWQFKNTETKLEEEGHKVYRVNLTGLGERYHLANTNIDLNVHIKDVVNTILFERLDDVILMGHSYGGMVITGVADSLPDRIKKLVYLDAFIPEDGESAFSLIAQRSDSSLINQVQDGYIIPAWVRDTTIFPRDVPHPATTLQSKIQLKNPDRLSIPSTYIFTFEGEKEKDSFYPFVLRAKQYGWKVVDFEADHNPQIKKLEELVEILLNEH